MKSSNCFSGLMPALMTPCDAERRPQFGALCEKASRLISAGMTSVIYCGSMGDWPLLSDAQRQEGVAELTQSGIPVIVGTGAQNSAQAVAHARHAQEVGAAGLMLIPRVLSRGSSSAAQKDHFGAILAAAPDLPAVIYNSPYYGFETRADLFFSLREKYPNLVGFKEFGGAAALSYAAEHITSGDSDLRLLIGVDTQMFHGYINCGAVGAITGIGNVLPKEVLYLETLCKRAAGGDQVARRQAWELDQAMMTLAIFDEGPDLVLYFKFLLTLLGEKGYEHHFNPSDQLSKSQAGFAASQLAAFKAWWQNWDGRPT